MALTISPPHGKALKWESKLREHLLRGAVHRKELESVVGKLSFSQTSVFGRIGRAMMTALFQKQNAKYYLAELSGREASVLRWWTQAITNMTPRHTRSTEPVCDLIIYTDAATTTQIIAAVLIGPRTFRKGRTVPALISKRVGPIGRPSFLTLAKYTGWRCWQFSPSFLTLSGTSLGSI